MSLKHASNRFLSRGVFQNRLVGRAAQIPVPLAALLGGVLFSVSAVCQQGALQSDWIELVKGYKGSTMGAELIQIQEGSTPDMQTIVLAIPKTGDGDRTAMEEVVVVGKMPEQAEPLEFTYEWLQDYDKDRYGLVVHLRKDNKWPIRLYFNAAGGFVTDEMSPVVAP